MIELLHILDRCLIRICKILLLRLLTVQITTFLIYHKQSLNLNPVTIILIKLPNCLAEYKISAKFVVHLSTNKYKIDYLWSVHLVTFCWIDL